MNKSFKQLVLGIAFAACSVAASADVVTYSDASTFNSAGGISFDSNFADFGSAFQFPGDPFVRGGVTYTSGANLTVGPGAGYSIGNYQTVMSYNYWSPITGTIASTTPYTLFGFDLAVTSGLVNITIDTNLGSYFYDGLSIPNGSPNFAFEGFQATGAGEYFTGFQIATNGPGYLPGMTNVELGNAVPEPKTYTMLLAGLALIGLMISRRKNI